MKCPYCGSLNTGCKDARPQLDRMWRRRRCFDCKKSFTTYEVYSPDGKHTDPEMFMRKCIRNSIKK